MANKEAVKIIKECKEKGFKHTFYTLNEYHTALDMAIKAVERESKLKEVIDTLQVWIATADDEFDREEMGRVCGLKEALHLIKKTMND